MHFKHLDTKKPGFPGFFNAMKVSACAYSSKISSPGYFSFQNANFS